jgi:hypothetical protein
MVCLGNVCGDSLHKGGNDDDDYDNDNDDDDDDDNNNNNNNNRHGALEIGARLYLHLITSPALKCL